MSIGQTLTESRRNPVPKSVLPQELHQRRQAGELLHVVDVRTPREHAEVRVEGARLMPLGQMDPQVHLAEARQQPIYVLCRSGSRAELACAQLEKAGFEQVFLVQGGILAWEQAGLPVTRTLVQAISLERQVRIVVGSLVLLGLVLGWRIHPAGYLLSGFVGSGLIFAGVTDWCGMALLLARMPWNR